MDRLCYEWDDIKPDMVILGKALSGGSESAHHAESQPTKWTSADWQCTPFRA